MAIPAALPEMSPGDSLPLPPVLLRELVDALGSIRFGSVELVIHEGRVVQLEKRQKVRFDTEVTPLSRADRTTGSPANKAKESRP
jgi:hypothetical protein